MEDIFVKELMEQDPITESADAPLSAVTSAMAEQKVSCIPIVKNNKPVGIVTERDLAAHLNRILSNGLDADTPVKALNVMTHPPVTISEDATMFDALVLTQSRNIRHLPVVDDQGDVVGILTYTDVARALNRIIEMQREIIDASVEEKTRILEAANDRLKALSLEDPLLGIGNRRAMEVDLTYTHNTAIRYNRPYSVVLFDIDCFKQYNDHYGHQAGDAALRMVSDHIKGIVRNADRLYRYGGEEILLLLPETPQSGAEALARRAIDDLKRMQIPHVKSDYKVLTMSGGVGTPQRDDLGEDVPGWEQTVELADVSLYRAKRAGRNQIVSAQAG